MYRQDSSVARVIPMRGPVTISGTSRRGRSSNGGRSRPRPSCAPRDPERLTELARARAERAQRLHAAPAPLLLDPRGRFERPNEHRICVALIAADEIQTPMDAIRAIDVRVAGRAEHHCVSGRPATVAMTRRVFLVVRLHFYDPSTDSVHEQRGADQVRRHLVDAAREEVTRQHRTRRRSERGRETLAASRRQPTTHATPPETMEKRQARHRRQRAGLEVSDRGRARRPA